MRRGSNRGPPVSELCVCGNERHETSTEPLAAQIRDLLDVTSPASLQAKCSKQRAVEAKLREQLQAARVTIRHREGELQQVRLFAFQVDRS